MKGKQQDFAKAQQLVSTYERMRNAGLVLTVKCLSQEQRRAAYLAQEAITETPAPKRPPAGFAYKGAHA